MKIVHGGDVERENPIIFEVSIGKSVINVFGHRLTSLSSQSDDDCECEQAKLKKRVVEKHFSEKSSMN